MQMMKNSVFRKSSAGLLSTYASRYSLPLLSSTNHNCFHQGRYQAARRYATTTNYNIPITLVRKNKIAYRLKALFLALVPIVTFGLGTWQIQRLRWKVGLIELCEERLSTPPITLPKKFNRKLVDDLYYRRVNVTGRFQHDKEMLVGLRSRFNQPGYNVITPLERDDGSSVLVNRGWISRDKADPSTRPNSLQEGIVTIDGMVKNGEKRGIFVPMNKVEENEWLWADIDTMAERTNALPILVEKSLDVSPYVVNKLIDEGDPVGKTPAVELRNTHTQYAVTWYSLSALTSVMFFMYIKKPRTGTLRKHFLQG
ncbi:10876_t:CDS:2 [Paraglomus brasilianum]|uniref:SURF1-like protein n=1 Tax=Paraglomus brasilianum TaxID=144538 RepID=A0A9N8ZD76_9GLOM|nr:10876_t:CDS:2 [Paraglomus brasilianum]